MAETEKLDSQECMAVRRSHRRTVSLIQGRNQGSVAVPSSRAYAVDESLWGIKQLSVFDTGLGNEIPIDKIGGLRSAESVRRLVVAPPVRYACDDG